MVLTYTTQFFIPIILLLGLSALTSILIYLFHLKFLPAFAVEIVVGFVISGWFNRYIGQNNMVSIVDGIYALGLVMIMFLSGYDVDFDVFDDLNINQQNDCNTCHHRKCRHCKHVHIFKTVILITVLTFAASVFVSFLFSSQVTGNRILAIILMTLIFASTFAGLVVPIIHNEGLSHTVIGKILAAIANTSEALSIIFLTILMIATDLLHPEYWVIAVLLFVLIIALWIMKRFQFGKAFSKFTDAIDQVATRFIIVMILGLVLLSDMSGGEYILGAFAAGIIVRQAQFSEDIINSLSRVIYGIFAPMFFIIVGTKIHFASFISDPGRMLMVLYIMLALLLAELPVLILLKWYRLNTVVPSMVLLSCTIVVPIAANHINETLQLYSEEFGEALVLASLLLCVIGTILFQINFPFGNNKEMHQESIHEEKIQ